MPFSYESLLSHQKIGFVRVDNQDLIVDVNSSFCELLGYKRNVLIGMESKHVVHKGSQKEFSQQSAINNRSNDSNSYTIWHLKSDGSKFLGQVTALIEYDENGDQIGSVGIVQDVTENLIRENKLEEILQHQKALNEKLLNKNTALEVINKFSTTILKLAKLEELLSNVTEQTCNLLKIEDCVIYIRDFESNVLRQFVSYGNKRALDGGIFSPISLKIGQGIVGSAAQHKKTELVNDLTLDPRYIVDDASRYSELSVPILFDDEVIAVLDSESSIKNFYTEEHVLIFQTISNLISTRLQELLVNEQLNKKSALLKEAIDEIKKLQNDRIVNEEKERISIAREIHDNIGSTLFATKMLLDNYLITKSRKLGIQEENLNEVNGLLHEVIVNSRELVNSLEIGPNSGDTFKESLELFFDKVKKIRNLNIELFWEGNKDIDDKVKSVNVFRIIQDFLSQTTHPGLWNQVSIKFNNQLQQISTILRFEADPKSPVKEIDQTLYSLSNKTNRLIDEINGHLHISEEDGVTEISLTC
ncbi:MAG: PAS domain S-box-containing protein [Bacteroidia bacterium]|jgi:PAS domain S-box-containing protein